MPVEEPVIVSGGSVTIRFKDKFKEQADKPGEKQHKHDTGRLVRVEVNGTKVADLQATDEVRIIYED